MWTQILVHQCKDADNSKGRAKLSDMTLSLTFHK